MQHLIIHQEATTDDRGVCGDPSYLLRLSMVLTMMEGIYAPTMEHGGEQALDLDIADATVSGRVMRVLTLPHAASCRKIVTEYQNAEVHLDGLSDGVALQMMILRSGNQLGVCP